MFQVHVEPTVSHQNGDIQQGDCKYSHILSLCAYLEKRMIILTLQRWVQLYLVNTTPTITAWLLSPLAKWCYTSQKPVCNIEGQNTQIPAFTWLPVHTLTLVLYFFPSNKWTSIVYKQYWSECGHKYSPVILGVSFYCMCIYCSLETSTILINVIMLVFISGMIRD